MNGWGTVMIRIQDKMVGGWWSLMWTSPERGIKLRFWKQAKISKKLLWASLALCRTINMGWAVANSSGRREADVNLPFRIFRSSGAWLNLEENRTVKGGNHVILSLRRNPAVAYYWQVCFMKSLEFQLAHSTGVRRTSIEGWIHGN